MSATSVLSPTEFESRLERYLFERSEEWRAVRVGEKDVSQQAEIVRRFADLFSREQLDALRDAEQQTLGDDRERIYRVRKTCESGLISGQLAEREDELENRLLAERVTFKGEEMPLRTRRQSSRCFRDTRTARSSARSRRPRMPASTRSGSICCARARSWPRSTRASLTPSSATRR